MTCVYFGPGDDAQCVKNPMLKWVKHFILIDALPDTPHYHIGQAGYAANTPEAFCRNIVRAFNAVGAWLWDHSDNKMSFRGDGVNDYYIVTYYYNMSVEDSLRNAETKSLISNARYIYEKGFHPWSHGLSLSDHPNTYKNLADMLADNELGYSDTDDDGYQSSYIDSDDDFSYLSDGAKTI